MEKKMNINNFINSILKVSTDLHFNRKLFRNQVRDSLL